LEEYITKYILNPSIFFSFCIYYIHKTERGIKGSEIKPEKREEALLVWD